jgi:hypothetical protein
MKRSRTESDNVREKELVASFGEARLFKRLDGKLKIEGGTEEDQRKAKEWIKSFHLDPNAAPPGSRDFDRNKIKTQLAALAQKGVFVGTSSWKYEGWVGMLYDQSRYMTRGKLSKARFERNCLAEYAEVFKTVCVDAAYYKFPDHRYLESMVSHVPADFQFAFKVTDEITVKKFTNLPRFGVRAGKPNENFLNPDLFASAFVKPFEQFRQNVGLFMFEFSRFYPTDCAHGRDFVADLGTVSVD